MADGTNGISFQPGAGQPQGNASSVEPGKEAPQYITKDELSRSLQELRTELERRTQSLSDQTSARIEKRVQARLADIERAAQMFGTEPSVVEAAKQRALMEELTHVPDPQPAASPAQATKQTEEQPDPVVIATNIAAERLVRKYGVTLTAEEVSALPTDSPEAWLDELEAKLAEKKAQGAIPPAARVPSMGGSGLPIDKTTLLAELDNLLQHPNKANLARIRELRAKLNT